MRNFTFLLFCLGASVPCVAQSLFPMKQMEDSLRFKILITNRQLSLEYQNSGGFFNTQIAELPVITAIALQEDDLVLTYKPGKVQSDYSFQMRLFVETPDSNLLEPHSGELITSVPTTGRNETRQMIWQGFADPLLGLDTVYTLRIRYLIFGALDCEKRPEFTLKKRLPHYGAGFLGLALVGLGQVYNQQKKDAYTQYQTAWASGAPLEQANSPFFRTAEDKRKDARICTYTGWAILGADALWFTIRWMKFRRKQRVFDLFCAKPVNSSLGWHPVLFPDNPYPGIGVTFTFSNSRP